VIFENVALRSKAIDFLITVYDFRVELPTVNVVSKFWMMGRNIEPVSSFPMSRQPWQKVQRSLSIDLSEAAGGALDCGVSAGECSSDG